MHHFFTNLDPVPMVQKNCSSNTLRLYSTMQLNVYKAEEEEKTKKQNSVGVSLRQRQERDEKGKRQNDGSVGSRTL